MSEPMFRRGDVVFVRYTHNSVNPELNSRIGIVLERPTHGRVHYEVLVGTRKYQIMEWWLVLQTPRPSSTLVES